MNKRKTLPVGLQSFREITENGYLVYMTPFTKGYINSHQIKTDR